MRNKEHNMEDLCHGTLLVRHGLDLNRYRSSFLLILYSVQGRADPDALGIVIRTEACGNAIFRTAHGLAGRVYHDGLTK